MEVWGIHIRDKVGASPLENSYVGIGWHDLGDLTSYADSREHLKDAFLETQGKRMNIINAIVHNDFSREVPPKFELFSDRLEITSVGSIPAGFTQEEFFMGYSVPQNKELMRIFRDLDIVEQMGSGINRILKSYPHSIYHFSPNFIRVIMPFAEGFIESQSNTAQAMSIEAQVLIFCQTPRTRAEIQ